MEINMINERRDFVKNVHVGECFLCEDSRGYRFLYLRINPYGLEIPSEPDMNSKVLAVSLCCGGLRIFDKSTKVIPVKTSVNIK